MVNPGWCIPPIQVGIALCESGKDWTHEQLGGFCRDTQSNSTDRRISKLVDDLDGLTNVIEGFQDRGLKFLSRCRKRHTAARSVQQPNAQTFFQPSQRMTQRRGTDPKFGPGATEAAVFRHFQEASEICQISASKYTPAVDMALAAGSTFHYRHMLPSDQCDAMIPPTSVTVGPSPLKILGTVAIASVA